jgi:hypothetical protein
MAWSMLMARGSTTQLNNAADHTALLKLRGSNHWTVFCVTILFLEGVVSDLNQLTTIMHGSRATQAMTRNMQEMWQRS